MRVKVRLKYKDKEYEYIDRYRNVSFETIRFMYEENNESCDCNRSLFIKRYCNESFPELECGEEIELISLEEVKE